MPPTSASTIWHFSAFFSSLQCFGTDVVGLDMQLDNHLFFLAFLRVLLQPRWSVPRSSASACISTLCALPWPFFSFFFLGADTGLPARHSPRQHVALNAFFSSLQAVGTEVAHLGRELDNEPFCLGFSPLLFPLSVDSTHTLLLRHACRQWLSCFSSLHFATLS